MSESTKNVRDDNLAKNPFVSGREITVTADTDGLVRLASDFPIRGVIVLESDVPCTAAVYYNRNGYVKIRLTRTWEFLERRDVGTTGITFNFDTQLNSDDCELMLTGFWKGKADFNSLAWVINGTSSLSLTACDTAALSIRTALGAAAPGLFIAVPQAAAFQEHTFESVLTVGTSDPRLMRGNSSMTHGTGATDLTGAMLAGRWEELTEITSVGVTATAADHLLAGSYFELFRKKAFNKTKVKLWVY